MMRGIIVILVLLGLHSAEPTNAQNLVPNPSFEQFINCPTNGAQIYQCPPWADANTTCTSVDYFNACSSVVGIPSNVWGYQYPRTGNAYAGFGGYVSTSPLPVREFLQVNLIAPLEAGMTYAVEFYVSHANASAWAIDRVGLYLSVGSPVMIDCGTGMYIPQIANPAGQIIADTLNWVKISGNYTAAGGEDYITIGNFYDDVSTQVQYSPPSPPTLTNYYYVDDVSVVCVDPSCDSLQESSMNIPNVFTPNGDGVNDIFLIETIAVESLSCTIYNRWGVKIAQLDRLGQAWDGRLTGGQEALEGVYYYIVKARGEEGKEISKTGFIQLLR